MRTDSKGHLNVECQTPCLSCISNAALLSLELVLSAGRNISLKKWLRDFFLKEDSHFTSDFPFATLGWTQIGCKKRTVWKIVSISTRQTFFRWGTHLYMSLFPFVCLLRTISQEQYSIWSWFWVHLCKIIISPGFFSFFWNFEFLGCYGGKRAKNNPKWKIHTIFQEQYSL